MNEISITACQSQGQFLAMREPGTKLKLDFHTSIVEGTKVLSCKGRITYRHEATALSARVLDLVRRNHQIILDLSGVERIDSAGLGELVSVFTWSQAVGCSLKLAGPNKLVRYLLELTKLTSVLAIYPSVEEAIADRRAV